MYAREIVSSWYASGFNMIVHFFQIKSMLALTHILSLDTKPTKFGKLHIALKYPQLELSQLMFINYVVVFLNRIFVGGIYYPVYNLGKHLSVDFHMLLLMIVQFF